MIPLGGTLGLFTTLSTISRPHRRLVNDLPLEALPSNFHHLRSATSLVLLPRLRRALQRLLFLRVLLA